MQLYNLPARSERNAEVGLVWGEKLTNNQGTFRVPKYSAIRVRATGATVVTIAGVLSATMSTGEIMMFNAGTGDQNDKIPTVEVVISGAAAFVQVGQEQVPRPPGLVGQ